jgi:hypothetical protein
MLMVFGVLKFKILSDAIGCNNDFQKVGHQLLHRLFNILEFPVVVTEGSI